MWITLGIRLAWQGVFFHMAQMHDVDTPPLEYGICVSFLRSWVGFWLDRNGVRWLLRWDHKMFLPLSACSCDLVALISWTATMLWENPKGLTQQDHMRLREPPRSRRGLTAPVILLTQSVFQIHSLTTVLNPLNGAGGHQTELPS